MFVSVIISSCGRPQFLAETVESVLAQSGRPGFNHSLSSLGMPTLLRPQSVTTIDRRQRLRRNLLALRDLGRGRIDPKLVLEIGSV